MIASKADIGTLSLLSQVSSTFYAYYNAFLYQNANDACVPTLALSQENRLPLTGPHPATFVKEVMISDRNGFYDEAFENVEEMERFKERLSAAMHNISKYAPKEGLRSFTFMPRYSGLHDIFTVQDPAWRSLESLVIACELYHLDKMVVFSEKILVRLNVYFSHLCRLSHLSNEFLGLTTTKWTIFDST